MQGELRHDGSRSTSLYNRRKNYLRILMQQGRVQLDADWNEQVDSLVHHLQTLASDLFGPHGGPPDNLGFEINKIILDSDSKSLTQNNFSIGSGNYYVNGILCTLETVSIELTTTNTIGKQLIPTWAIKNRILQKDDLCRFAPPNSGNFVIQNVDNSDMDFSSITTSPKFSGNPNTVVTDISPLTTYRTQLNYRDEKNLTFSGRYLVYLDVWEYHVNNIEDANDQVPGIREVALGKADTTTRSRIVSQVKALKLSSPITDPFTFPYQTNYSAFLKEIKDIIKPGQGRLVARATKPGEGKNDPCLIAPESKYRGSENQLYRVEIFSNDSQGTTFVWSRENSAVVFKVNSFDPSNNYTIVVLEHLGYDSRGRFC
jgi:hypothetical protein